LLTSFINIIVFCYPIYVVHFLSINCRNSIDVGTPLSESFMVSIHGNVLNVL
jgi:hypothetical protein